MNKKLAIIINADETASVDKEFDQSLDSMQKAVGGYIEMVLLDRITLSQLEAHFGVKLPLGTHAYANEDGNRLGLDHNSLASRLLGRRLVGNIVVTRFDD